MRNYFGLFLQTTTHFELKTYFELDSKEGTAVSVASFYSFVCTDPLTPLT